MFISKLDADQIEREKRKINVVVLKVTEPFKDASSVKKERRIWSSAIMPLNWKVLILKPVGGQAKLMNQSQTTG